ncbi:MAG: hypothetical protein U1E36_08580 [Rickettsiales bacterium]
MQRFHKMSRCFLALLTGAALVFSMPVLACEEGGPEGPGGSGGKAMHMKPPKTLEEARARAKQHLDELNSMSEADFQKRQQMHQQMRDKWQSMSPEEKEAAKGKMQQWKQNHQGGMMAPHDGGTPPAPGGDR